MKNIVIDFTYANKGQKAALERFKSNNGTNIQDEMLNVPMGLILALQSGLSKVLIESKLDMFWYKSEVDNKLLIKSLAGFLGNMGDLANFLEVDLITEVQEIQLTPPEIIFNQMAYRITTLNWNKRHARNTLVNQMIPLLVELTQSFNFSIEELEKTYKSRMF